MEGTVVAGVTSAEVEVSSSQVSVVETTAPGEVDDWFSEGTVVAGVTSAEVEDSTAEEVEVAAEVDSPGTDGVEVSNSSVQVVSSGPFGLVVVVETPDVSGTEG